MAAAISLMRANSDKPLKRSRTGCLTCRKRKKKCDEQYENSSCARCKEGGWKCFLPDTVDAAPPTSHLPASTPKGSSMATDILLDGFEAAPSHSDPPVDIPIEGFWFGSFLQTSRDTSPPPRIFEEPGPSAYTTATDLPVFTPVSPPNKDEPVGDLLLDYYTKHVFHGWASAFPPSTCSALKWHCEAIIHRHPLPAAAARALAAAYLGMQRREQQLYALRCQPFTPEIYIGPGWLALDLDPNKWLEDALVMATTGSGTPPTVEEQLWALYDLRLAVLVYFDTAQDEKVADLCQSLMVQVFGPNPALDLSVLEGPNTVGLRCSVMDDLIRSLANRSPTFYNFSYTKMEDRTADSALSFHNGCYDNWFGLPSSMALLLAGSSNVCASAYRRVSRNEPIDQETTIQANELVAQLQLWKPERSIYDSQPDWHIATAPEITTAHELWRRLGLLLIYRWVHLASLLDHSVRDTIEEMVDLLKALSIFFKMRKRKQPASVDLWTSYYSAPCFFVGSLLFKPEDRQVCSSFLDDMGPTAAVRDLAAILQLIWHEADVAGVPLDWFEVLQKHGKTMMGFF